MTGVFTNNWKGMKNRLLLGHCASAAGLDTVYNTGGNLVSPISGHNYKFAFSPLNNVYGAYDRNSSTTYCMNLIRFGTSDTTPTAADIDLGNPWSSGISYVSVNSGTPSVSGSAVSRTFTVTVQNTAAASVTVREFGIFCYLSGSPESGYVMLYRAVLDEPVTIAQYESATLTFTVTMTLSDPN